MMYLLGIAPFVSSLSFSDLRAKELKMLLSSDTLEHTKKLANNSKNTLKKETRELMNKRSQISQLNESNKSTLSSD